VLKRLSLIFIFCLLVCTINAQTRPDEVPSATKEKISERLKLFYKYKENEQWDKVYEFLLQPQPITKQEYVKNLTDPLDKLEYIKLKFQPIDFSWSDSLHEVQIQGCEIEQKKGKSPRKWNEIIVATLKNGEWCFSAWGEPDQSKSWCK
jgi:hypothetical protein